jgi:hypothetical protein
MNTPENDAPRDPADNAELVAAYQEVLDRYGGRRRPDPGDPVPASPPVVVRTRRWVAALGILALLGFGYVWGLRPDWLFSRDVVRTLSPEEEDRTLRLGLYLQHHRVMEYRRTRGKVPAALPEAGDVEEGVEYLPTGDSTFQLRASNERLSLELDQSADPETILDRGSGEERTVR